MDHVHKPDVVFVGHVVRFHDFVVRAKFELESPRVGIPADETRSGMGQCSHGGEGRKKEVGGKARKWIWRDVSSDRAGTGKDAFRGVRFVLPDFWFNQRVFVDPFSQLVQGVNFCYIATEFMKSFWTNVVAFDLTRFLTVGVFAVTFEVHSTRFQPSLLAAEIQSEETAPTFTDDGWVSMGEIPGANGPIYATTVDGSGNLYVGGEFTMIGSIEANNIAKWNGEAWLPIDSGIDGVVWTLAVSGNDLYAGGEFTSAGGIEANNIAKWDGHVWTSLNSGVDNDVYALAVLEDNIYVGGKFNNAGGTDASSIAKWNGNEWSALGSGMSSELYASNVYALVVIDFNLFVGGYFSQAGGIEASGIAKWDGVNWSPLDTGVSFISYSGIVYSMAVKDNELYAGGQFDTAGGVAVTNIAKWNGSRWLNIGNVTYESNHHSTSPSYVYTLAVLDSQLYIGGVFNTAGGVAAHNVARWNGSSWFALGSGAGQVRSITVSGDNLFVGGNFDDAGGIEANHIAKWNGNSWSALGSGINNTIYALAASDNGLYAGGRFTTVGKFGKMRHIAKWNGSTWLPLGEGVSWDVFALALSGTDLYVGGRFTAAGGIEANHIAKWEGSEWAPLGSGVSDDVRALAVAGNDLYAGGDFLTAGGIEVNHIAKWDGSEWSPLGSGTDGPVLALEMFGSNLFVGGNFISAGGVKVNYIAKWNGNTWSSLGSGLDEGPKTKVIALVASDENLYLGGYFFLAKDLITHRVNFIAAWDGSNWSPLGPEATGMSSQVNALTVSNGNLFAGGRFRAAAGFYVNYIAKWDGNEWSPFGSGMNNYVHALAVFNDNLYAGGEFLTAGGKVSPYIARAFLDAVPPLEVVNGRATVFFRVPEGEYEIYRSTELNDWELITTRYAGETGGIDFVDEDSPEFEAFYRAVRVEP